MKSLLVATVTGLVWWEAGAKALPAEGNLLENGSFESPEVTEKAQLSDGGDPSKSATATSWARLQHEEIPEGGKFTLGLTNKIARTGKQALYVDFDRLVAVSKSASVETKLISVRADSAYRVAIWGRVDRTRPIALDERRPSMWLRVSFYLSDGTTEAGDAVEGAEMIPGIVTPGFKRLPLFVATRWTESSAEFQTPPATQLVKIAWSWVIPTDPGETDGTIYWDDASLIALKTPAVENGNGVPKSANDQIEPNKPGLERK